MKITTRKIVYSIFILVLLGFGIFACQYLIYRYGGIKYIVLKPFAQECGIGGVTGPFKTCQCQGLEFREMYLAGNPPKYCFGECGSCECEWVGYWNGDKEPMTSKKVSCDDIEKMDGENFLDF